MRKTLGRWARHTWLDAADARRLVPAAATERLRAQVMASERQHTGQIRICIEGGLPLSYLWRQGREHLSAEALTRQRAVMMFSKLRVWDTEHNNGVLIYLLLAEHAIELVADRGLARAVDTPAWQALTDRLAGSLKAGRFEEGLTRAVEDVSQWLIQEFPAPEPGAARAPNELPDEPVFR